MIFFGLARKTLMHVFSENEKGEYIEMIFDVTNPHLVWSGVISKAQYKSMLEMFRKVALLDNGDETSS